MSEEMKLLMALCKALGFKVERELDYQTRRVSFSQGMDISNNMQSDRILATELGELIMDEDGMYISMLKRPEVSYRLIALSED